MFKKIIKIAALLLVLSGSLELFAPHGGGGGGHGGGGHGGGGHGGYHGGGHGGYHGGGGHGGYHGGGHGGHGYHHGGYGHGGYGRGWAYGGWGYGLGLGYWGAYGWGLWGPYNWYAPWAWGYSYPWWYYANTYGPTWTTTVREIEVPTYEVDREQWTDERGSNYWEFYNDTNLAVTIEGPQGKTELAPKSADKVPHINSFKYIATATDEKGKTHKITVNTTKHYMRVLYKDGKMRIERY